MKPLICGNCSGSLIQLKGDSEVWICEFCKTRYLIPRSSTELQKEIQENFSSKSNSKKSKLLPWIIVSTLSLLFLILFGLFFFIRQSTPSQSQVSMPKVESAPLVSTISNSNTPSTDKDYSKYNIMIVRSNGGLRMREAPDLKSKIVTIVPNEALVEFMEDSKVEVQAEGKVGSFFKINWDNNIGYVFSGLLEFELQVDSIATGYYKDNDFSNSENYRVVQLAPFRDFPHVGACGFDEKYGGQLNCIDLVYNSNGKIIFDSRNFPNLQGYRWVSWETSNKVLLNYSTGDEGCGTIKEIILNVNTKDYKVIKNNSGCGPDYKEPRSNYNP